MVSHTHRQGQNPEESVTPSVWQMLESVPCTVGIPRLLESRSVGRTDVGWPLRGPDNMALRRHCPQSDSSTHHHSSLACGSPALFATAPAVFETARVSQMAYCATEFSHAIASLADSKRCFFRRFGSAPTAAKGGSCNLPSSTVWRPVRGISFLFLRPCCTILRVPVAVFNRPMGSRRHTQ